MDSDRLAATLFPDMIQASKVSEEPDGPASHGRAEKAKRESDSGQPELGHESLQASEREGRDVAEILFGEDVETDPEGEKPSIDEAEKLSAPATAEEIAEILLSQGLEENELTKEFTEFASDTRLSKDHIDKLMTLKQEQDAQAWDHVSEQWRHETNNSFSSYEIDLARDLVREYGDDEVRDLLNTYRMGNNPSLIRFLVNIARDRS